MTALCWISGVVITGGPEMHRRGLKPAMRWGLRRLVQRWHHKYLRRHFRDTAQSRYGYRRRSRAYTRRKRKKKGHARPMEYSRKTIRIARLPPRVTSTAKMASASMPLPWYVKMRPTKPNRPNLGAELLKTTAGEAKELEAVLHKETEARLKKTKKRRTVRT